MLDQTKGDLWVVPYATKSFDDPNYLEGREKYGILSTPGIASVEELAVSFVAWRRPYRWHNGGSAGRIGYQHQQGSAVGPRRGQHRILEGSGRGRR